MPYISSAVEKLQQQSLNPAILLYPYLSAIYELSFYFSFPFLRVKFINYTQLEWRSI